ncbi:MAG TPA: type II secretion system protein [Candidatus Paceibacterota bacterium]|nr:type II secretion system protein [Candidatus Paceibacterota bacterium]HOG37636.1 type II secretion system protein [Candidatus Woesebacteria bacterium]
MKNHKRQINKGFTLVEMLVSVSIFVIVALIVSGVLVQLSVAYKKAQAMRLLMDNLNFALEKMNLEIREGVSIDTFSDDSAIQFSQIGDSTVFCYSPLNFNERNTLVKCESPCPCSETSPNLKDMLSSGLELSGLRFQKFGPNRQERVLINIAGSARSSANQVTDFVIQTTATQRIQDPS